MVKIKKKLDLCSYNDCAISNFLRTFKLLMEVKLLWRRPNAKSGALRGGLRLLRLAEFVVGHQSSYVWLLVGHQSGSQ